MYDLLRARLQEKMNKVMGGYQIAKAAVEKMHDQYADERGNVNEFDQQIIDQSSEAYEMVKLEGVMEGLNFALKQLD